MEKHTNTHTHKHTHKHTDMHTHTHTNWKAEEIYGRSEASFNADNRLIEHNNSISVQQNIDILIRLFRKMGLKTNKKETKYIIFKGPAPS